MPVDHLFDPVSLSHTTTPLDHKATAGTRGVFPPLTHSGKWSPAEKKAKKRSKRRRKRAREVNNNLARLTVSSDISRLAAIQFSFDYADQFHRRAEETNAWGSSSSARRETSLN